MSIEVLPGPGHRGAVDLVDSRNGSDIDPLHVSIPEWTEFVAAVKQGKYDDVPTVVES
jgi:hypothetical protein